MLDKFGKLQQVVGPERRSTLGGDNERVLGQVVGKSDREGDDAAVPVVAEDPLPAPASGDVNDPVAPAVQGVVGVDYADADCGGTFIIRS